MKDSNIRKCILFACSILLYISGCAKKENTVEETTSTVSLQMDNINPTSKMDMDDLYRTSYEICPYSFYDSNGDGIGDLNGVIKRLDYIHEEMGFNQIWLTPIQTATSYHKYDIEDYYEIDSDFGTMDDFKKLVQECHNRNTKILLDLVINHTSSKHPWFLEACDYLRSIGNEEPDSKDCKYINYYNFSKEKKSGFVPLEGTDYYYEARFTSSMPDLNLEKEDVREEITNIISFWLGKGVDGFRLDATTSYYSDSQKDTISFLSWLNQSIKSIKEDAYLVGEAWTDTNVIAEYYTSGIDSFFNFPFSQGDGVIAKVVKGSIDASMYAKSLQNIETIYSEKNTNYIDAPFYTNHDTNRSAGYYSGEYGEQRTKLAGALNLFMGGNVFVYYGEEIGMKGSGEDPNKRMPMYWGIEEGTCNPPVGSSNVEMKYGSYEDQAKDPTSILHYYQKAIALRNHYPVIARGNTIPNENLSNESICIFEKVSEEYDSICIVFNTSEKTKKVDISSLSYSTLSAVLNTSNKEVTLENGILTIPAFDIAVLEK